MNEKLTAAQLVKDKDREKIQKRIDQIEITSELSAAEEIERRFERLFDVLFIIDDEAAVQKRDVLNVFKTYKLDKLLKGVKDDLLDPFGDITEL